MRAIEKYYTIAQAAWQLELSGKTITQRMLAGEFGREIVNLGGEGKAADWRIPASGLNAWLDTRRLFSAPPQPIAARSVGELRRKAQSAAVESPG